MIHTIKYLSVFLFLLFVSCESHEKEIAEKKEKIEKELTDVTGIVQGNSKAKYVGKAGELIVVADNTVFTEEIGELLDSTFGDYIRPFYPPQKMFEIRFLDIHSFKNTSLRIRNVLQLELTDKVERPQLTVKKDYYANGQLYSVAKAKTMDELVDLLILETPRLVKLYDKQEWLREYHRHKKANNKVLKSKVKKQFGITLELPRTGRYESVQNNYAHILFPDRSRQMDLQTRAESAYSTSKANFIQSGIMLWQIPFKDSSQLDPAYLMKVRDTILKYNALHEYPGVYMGTQDHPAVIPVHKRIKVGTIEGYEFRGLYKFTGKLEPSGGMFWSFHFLHPERNKIVAVSAYLDTPPTMNPALDLRKLQAILYSVRLEG